MATTDEETPLVTSQSPLLLNHKKDVHILSFAFLLIFLAYSAIQNLQSTINAEGDLGTTSIGILYLSFTFFSLFSSLIVKKLGSRNALILGTTGYMLFAASNLNPSWFTMVPASLYIGFAASIIWVGQGTYLTSAARSHANDHNLDAVTVIGKFNGEFWGMYATNQVFGNLFILVVVRDEKGGNTSGTTLLFVLFLISLTIGMVLMLFLTKNSKESHQDPPSTVPTSLLKSMLKLLLNKRMLFVIPLIMYSGLEQAFVSAKYTKDIVMPTLGERGVGGAMAIYGVFDAICAVSVGRLTSGLSSITIILLAGALVQLIVMVWLLLAYSLTGGVLGTLLPLLIGGLWGIGDAVFSTQLSILIGTLFEHDLEGAFALLNFWQSMSIGVVFFISASISLQTMVIFMLAALSISMCGFLFLTLKLEKVFSCQAS